MPEPSNIARAVLNSSNGRWYKYEREGDRLKALDPDGLILKPAGSGANAIDVYRVTDERGDFKAMVATAEKPATLKVWARDADTDNLTLVEEVSCTSFAQNRCRFVLASDYSAFGNRAARLDFTDGTAGTITASYDDVTLYEFQGTSYGFERPGSYRILAALVENLDDKRVVFESSDPSVCRIERGSVASTYMRVSEAPQQTDQYCVLIGAGKGTCTVTCRSIADPTLEDSVEVTVITHPDDEPRVIGGDLAQELTDLLDGIRLPVSLRREGMNSENTVSTWAASEGTICRRDIQVPGTQDDLFLVELLFTGTVPTQWCNGHEISLYSQGYGTALMLAVGVTGNRAIGDAPMSFRDGNSKYVLPSNACDLLGVDGAIAINGPTDYDDADDTKEEALNRAVKFYVQGGETIILAWLFPQYNVQAEGGWFSSTSPFSFSYDGSRTGHVPPVGDWVAKCDVTAITLVSQAP